MDRLQQAIAAGHREGRPVSLLLMDLDRFKEVNDALGHQAGDLLLQELGARLLSALRRGTDTISRLGGDEFAIILPGTDAEGALGVVDSLLKQLQAPFVIEGQPVIVGASIGVAVSPDHGEEADELLRRADVAMYVAKRTSSGCSMYRFEQDRNSPDRLLLISELRRAIDRDQLVLHYQPTIDLQTGELASVEALVRWQHPQRGLLSPDEFVPIAEQVALIESLSQWVLRTALAQLSAWRSAGFEVSVAVNLSMRSLQDERLPEKIAELLELAEVPSSLLILEITESTLMQDPARTLTIIEKLRRMGIRIAIDDFGTGHSSLAYLKRLTVDEVKIDRAFVRDIATDATDRLIVSSTIDLAHSLGLCVVGEGIEDRVTAALLAELGCDQAQGFYLSPPLWGDEIVPWERCRQNNALPLRLAA
jgi:diguanylate cyclase (GGDEF)-like protein